MDISFGNKDILDFFLEKEGVRAPIEALAYAETQPFMRPNFVVEIMAGLGSLFNLRQAKVSMNTETMLLVKVAERELTKAVAQADAEGVCKGLRTAFKACVVSGFCKDLEKYVPSPKAGTEGS